MTQPKLTVHISDSNEPYFNLALEDWLFRQLKPDELMLYLWRNAPTVVIGRAQNPWVECHLEKMESNNILLTRRQSGGGAVYQDLGNTNFTFLGGKDVYDKEANLQIVINALRAHDIEAKAQGRNDLVVNHNASQRKVSGSAFRQTQHGSFHHGTILINVDMSNLQSYLNPNKKKLEAKGVKSVRSRVANLTEINEELHHDALVSTLIDAFWQYHGAQSNIQTWDESIVGQHPDLAETYNLLKSWDWRFGRTLEFNHQFNTRFDWGTIDIRCLVNKGIIRDIQIFSDSLFPDFIDWLAESSVGVKYSPSAISSVMDRAKLHFPDLANCVDDLANWLLRELA